MSASEVTRTSGPNMCLPSARAGRLGRSCLVDTQRTGGVKPRYNGAMEERWLVKLPDGAEPPFRVFVNGVRQTDGIDYTVQKGHLVFTKPLAKEGRLGFWR